MRLNEVKVVELLFEVVSAAAIDKCEELFCLVIQTKSSRFCLACVGHSKTNLHNFFSTLRLGLLGIFDYPLLKTLLVTVYLLSSLQ